jgi:type II secretory pathway pseudopilin PulG
MRTRPGFSLIQVILATVVLVLVGTTMAPRFSEASADARIANLCESLQNVRRHIGVYRRQHEDRLPASAGESGEDFARRLTGIGENPAGDDSALQLERMPINPYYRLDTAGSAARRRGGTLGWRFDPATASSRRRYLRRERRRLCEHANL